MSSSRHSRPKPAPPSPSQRRWFQERRSEHPWEQDGLDHVRRLMPNAEPYRAWATFSFTAASGRIDECDLLIQPPDSSRKRTLRNPLHLTDIKSKDLKSRLESAVRKLRISTRVPRVEPAVFLTDAGLRAELDDVQATRVYGRDDACAGLPWIWRDLLSRPPQREQQRVTPELSQHVLPRLLDEIGIRVSTAHLRFGDDWSLAPTPLDVGPTWEDRLAERRGIEAAGPRASAGRGREFHPRREVARSGAIKLRSVIALDPTGGRGKLGRRTEVDVHDGGTDRHRTDAGQGPASTGDLAGEGPPGAQ